MMRLTFRTGFFLAVDIALLIVCLLHIPTLLDRPQAPFELTMEDGRIIIDRIVDSTAGAELKEGDELLFWEQDSVPIPEVVEFFTDLSSIDARVTVTYQRSGTPHTTTVTLIRYYGPSYPFIIYLVGIVTWSVGVFVLLKRRRDLTASALHWAMVALGVSVMITWGAISQEAVWPFVSRTLLFVSYMGVAASFFFFTAMFPRPKAGSVLLKSWLIFGPASVLVAAILYYHLRAIHLVSVNDYVSFQKVYDLFHIAVFVYGGGGILNFVHSYRTAASTEERKKLKWVLWGLCLGPAPFLLLNALPQVFLPSGLVPEEYTLIFLLLIPFAFAISFIRHRILDIEVVINRTTVYAIVLGVVTTLYYLVVITVASIIGTSTQSLSLEVSVAAAVLVALLFEPARRSIQGVVDRTFFRVRYNFREAQRRFLEEIKRCLDVQELPDLIVRRTDELIPVERIGFFTLQEPGHRVRLLAHRNYDMLQTHRVRFEVEKLKTRLQLPIGLDEKIEPGVPYESADPKVFRRWGMALGFTMASENSEFLGFLVLGEKKSGQRFSVEDVDLLNTVTTHAGLAIERITLQFKLTLEHAEAQRLEELNRLKSDFVSYVSHELRTPLTSIKMFAELLKTGTRKLDKKAQEYVRIIEGESDRLNRMINNILDSARIDRGVKEFIFIDVDLRKITGDVLKSMRYQLEKHRFRVEFKTSKRPLPIHADPDAVAQALINLVSNAIKYSTKKKYLKIALSRNSEWTFCRVVDRGSGISEEVLPHLFEKFYRDPSHSLRVQGVGLGLPLVKHIMEVHGGKVEVESEIGKGSSFTLCFPLEKSDNQTKR